MTEGRSCRLRSRAVSGSIVRGSTAPEVADLSVSTFVKGQLRFAAKGRRARVTELLDLLLLAPDIQDHVLELEAIDGVAPIAEPALRGLVRQASWAHQKAALAILTNPPRSSLVCMREH